MFHLKKNSITRYKYEVCRLKRQQQYIKSEMMGRALTQSCSRNFWKVVRKMSKSAKGRKATAPVIDNQSTDDDISNLFSTQLKGVLNSANNSINRSKLLTTVSDSLCSSDLTSVSVTPSIVLEASSHLKCGKSTELCTGLIKNITVRYCFNDSSIFGCFLDASKAFDRVDHHLLFEKLLQRNLSLIVVRALLTYHLQQKVSVCWNKSSSDKFSISNGVRQGGVLSPVLFPIYLDDLLLELERAGVGCYWRHHFVSAVCYVDNIALLAPSLSALQIMLETCTHYASLHSLIFNASKTQLIKFSRLSAFSVDSPLNFCFLGQRLCFSQSIVHLGHILSHDLSDKIDIVSIKKAV